MFQEFVDRITDFSHEGEKGLFHLLTLPNLLIQSMVEPLHEQANRSAEQAHFRVVLPELLLEKLNLQLQNGVPIVM